MKHIKYLWYVIRHKAFVFRAGLWLMPPGLWSKAIFLWRLIIHDWTKFLPSEWLPYAHFFYRTEKEKGDEYWEAISEFQIEECVPFGWLWQDKFKIAWNHHQKRNPHHWQYWILTEDSGRELLMPIPDLYLREMVADWCGAGRAITGRWDCREWYEANKHKMKIRKGMGACATREQLEKILADLPI